VLNPNYSSTSRVAIAKCQLQPYWFWLPNILLGRSKPVCWSPDRLKCEIKANFFQPVGLPSQNAGFNPTGFGIQNLEIDCAVNFAIFAIT
jgi:hypothetical protein